MYTTIVSMQDIYEIMRYMRSDSMSATREENINRKFRFAFIFIYCMFEIRKYKSPIVPFISFVQFYRSEESGGIQLRAHGSL